MGCGVKPAGPRSLLYRACLLVESQVIMAGCRDDVCKFLGRIVRRWADWIGVASRHWGVLCSCVSVQPFVAISSLAQMCACRMQAGFDYPMRGDCRA